jgi:hypothetical protein
MLHDPFEDPVDFFVFDVVFVEHRVEHLTGPGLLSQHDLEDHLGDVGIDQNGLKIFRVAKYPEAGVLPKVRHEEHPGLSLEGDLETRLRSLQFGIHYVLQNGKTRDGKLLTSRASLKKREIR